MGAAHSVASFLLGKDSHTEPEYLLQRIEILKQRGYCSRCIQRLMSLDLGRAKKLCPPANHENDCVCCFGLSANLDKVKKIVSDELGSYNYHDVQIEIPPKYIKPDNDIIAEFELPSSCNIKNYLRAKLNLELAHSPSGPTLQLRVAGPNDITCRLKWPDVFITGRYFKYSRRVSNSRFFKGQSISSVESELTKYFSKIIKCSSMTFTSSGREDADVRMIGSGRPFAIRVQNAIPIRPPTDINEYVQLFEEIVPSEVECENCVAAKGVHVVLNQPNMEPKHMKRYRCVVAFSRPVTDEQLERIKDVEGMTLYQRTPLRVAQSKTIQDKQKTIMKLDYMKISPKFITLDLETSKGTYIKEFVNSDFGRTRPSLGEILCPEDPIQCQLLQLDVVYVAED